jgi:SAM-dependent methyltransferase
MLIPSASLAKRYLQLKPVRAPDYLTNGRPLERAQMEYDDERGPEGFHCIFNFDLRDKDVLDLGCGFGGRAVYYREMGARSVIGIEPDQKNVAEAREFGILRNAQINAVAGTAEQIPLPDSCVDVITSYDVFEHVQSLQQTLQECYRVLRAGGVVYAVFPPFHHPTGGSHLHGYVSNSLAPQLLFSRRALLRALYQLRDEGAISYLPTMHENDALPQVNGTTISQFLRMLKAVPFSKKRVSLPPFKSNRFAWINGIAALGVRLPLLREIFTNRIVCELVK